MDGDEKFRRGLEMMGQVYGPGIVDRMKAAPATPYGEETVSHLFGDIWTRPGLSVRDRRLLVIGIAAMLGRADLLETQAGAALANGELNEAELEEIVLHLAFYVGWPNSTAVARGVQAAIAARKGGG